MIDDIACFRLPRSSVSILMLFVSRLFVKLTESTEIWILATVDTYRRLERICYGEVTGKFV